MMHRNFNQNNAVRLVGSPHVKSSAGYTDFVSMVGFRRCTFLVGVDDALMGDVDVQVYEATDAAGANARSLGNDYAATFDSLTDGGMAGIVEVHESALNQEPLAGEDYQFVGLYIDPAATAIVGAFAVLSEPANMAVQNGRAEGIAFVQGSDTEVAH